MANFILANDVIQKFRNQDRTKTVVLLDDNFNNPVIDTSVRSDENWDIEDSGDATVAALGTAEIGGGLEIALTSEPELQYAGVISSINLDPTADLAYQAILKIVTAPTGVGFITMGVINAAVAGVITGKAGAMFTIDSTLVLDVSTDDDVIDNEPATSGITLVVGTEYRLGIDMRDVSNVRFYCDGVRLNDDTTYDMSDIASTDLMACVAHVSKTSSADVGTIVVKNLSAGHNISY